MMLHRGSRVLLAVALQSEPYCIIRVLDIHPSSVIVFASMLKREIKLELDGKAFKIFFRTSNGVSFDLEVLSISGPLLIIGIYISGDGEARRILERDAKEL